jgi:CRISPR-associated endonuclease/helicase Cas3
MDNPLVVGAQTDRFSAAFELLTGRAPYPWQSDLYGRLATGDVPPLCAIPTGLGKTSVIAVWLLALGLDDGGTVAQRLPRRLVYVVNRRTIVDQATATAEQLRARLKDNAALAAVANRLASLAAFDANDGSPIGLSTLRGQYADNEEWKLDPARPAIVVGTVDMIGSKLLFRGYGDGRWKLPLHAGLLGEDALFVHDEAHLSSAFGRLLRDVERLRSTCGAPLRPWAVMELSATPGQQERGALQLTDADRALASVKQRLYAEKTLHVHSLGAGAVWSELAAQAVALNRQVRSCVVYATNPEQAGKVAQALRKAKSVAPEWVALLTGTLRGAERDALAANPVFRVLLNAPQPPAGVTAYLVATSAGEVGIDLDADAGVFDHATLDRFIQRAGRVNRAGGRRADIHVVVAPEKQQDDAANRRAAALELLSTLPPRGQGRDASPAALAALTRDARYPLAAAADPNTLPLESHRLDTWSLTSVRPALGPPVAPWLHGLQVDEPETELVWRADLPVDDATLADWLDAYPPAQRERARLPTRLAIELLAHPGRGEGSFVVIDEDRLARWRFDDWANKVADTPKASRASRLTPLLAGMTVVLPAAAGGLTDGQPTAAEAAPASDVADSIGVRERWQIESGDGGQWQARPLTGPDGDATVLHGKSLDDAARQLAQARGLRCVLTLPIGAAAAANDGDADAPAAAVAYLAGRAPSIPDDRDRSSYALRPQTLRTHLQAVGAAATLLGERLGLPAALVEALHVAAAAHDRGKDREVWQWAFGNSTGAEPMAKLPAARGCGQRLRGYRHELGSLLELRGDATVAAKAEADVLLHLIAAHHGHARPGFAANAEDTSRSRDENAAAIQEAMLRFARLSQRFGWWTLAYLEALLKAADVQGSKEL